MLKEDLLPYCISVCLTDPSSLLESSFSPAVRLLAIADYLSPLSLFSLHLCVSLLFPSSFSCQGCLECSACALSSVFTQSRSDSEVWFGRETVARWSEMWDFWNFCTFSLSLQPLPFFFLFLFMCTCLESTAALTHWSSWLLFKDCKWMVYFLGITVFLFSFSFSFVCSWSSTSNAVYAVILKPWLVFPVKLACHGMFTLMHMCVCLCESISSLVEYTRSSYNILFCSFFCWLYQLCVILWNQFS